MLSAELEVIRHSARFLPLFRRVLKVNSNRRQEFYWFFRQGQLKLLFVQAGFQMMTLQRRITAVTETTALLIAQLRELERLREHVRKALLLVEIAPRQRRRNGTRAVSGIFRGRPSSNRRMTGTGLASRGRLGSLERWPQG